VAAKLARRPGAALPRLGSAAPRGPVLLDTNVFINALAGRGPATLKTLLANLPLSLVSGPVVAELAWTRGRLDPGHPQTAAVLARYEGILSRIAPNKMLLADATDWPRAGALAGAVARGTAGAAKSIPTAFDRIELIHDALTALTALRAGATLVTSDRDFDLIMQLEPGLDVLFYDCEVPTGKSVDGRKLPKTTR
jgi:predicted nucleic acid-binding protein